MSNVTQADREAASKVLSSAITKEVLRGDYDDREIVQAFAAHRLATIEECAKVADEHAEERHMACESAKIRKAPKQEARDFESMAMQAVFVASDIRLLKGPHQ